MFLNPFMLAGLFAIAVPIAIHLLNRQKRQRIAWAAMRFLQASVQRNRRRLRVENWLLLLMRCALVALLALIAARPTLRASAGAPGRSAGTTVILLDNSYSMSQTDGAESNFDRSKKTAEQIIDSLSPGASCAVVLASDTADDLIPQPTTDLDLVRQTIREAPLTDRSTDLLPALRRAVEILSQKAGFSKQIQLITDDRQTGWRQFDAIRKLLDQYKSDIRTRVVLLPPASTSNIAVVELRLVSPIAVAGRPSSFEAQITNFSPSEARNVPVRLSIDNNPPSDQMIIDSLAAGQTRTATLSARLDAGYHTVAVSIPHDNLPADDSRTMAVHAISRLNVLLVDGSAAQSQQQHPQTLFLLQALVPVPPSQADQYYLHLKTISARELASTRLSEFDAIYLVDLPDFPEPVPQLLSDYFTHGGAVFLFPGPDTQINSYKKSSILPGELTAIESGAFTLSSQNLDPSLSRIWKDSTPAVFASAHINHRLALQASADMPTLIRYTDNAPALIDRPIGQGRLLLFTTSADTAWNDLPLHAELYVPLIQQTLASAVAHQDENLNIRVGQRFVWHPASELLGRDATIVPPGSHATPQSRAISLIDSRPTLEFADTSQAGPYQLTVADPRTQLKFAAQFDAEESNPQPLSAEQKKELATEAVLTDSPSNIASATFADFGSSHELWLPLALLAIALACVETISSYRFSQSK